MTPLAYEKWSDTASEAPPHPIFRALHASRLDSFLADSQDDGVMVIDTDGCILDCNQALIHRTGFPRSDVLGRSMVDIVVPSSRRRIDAAINDAIGGDGVRVRATGVKRSGGTCELAVTFVPLFADDHTVLGSLVITQNLSEAADAALDRERHDALLELAGRVAGFVGWSLNLDTGELGWSGTLPALGTDLPANLTRLTQLLSTADAARLARALERCEREQRLIDLTFAVTTPSGVRHLRLVGERSTTPATRRGIVSGAAHDVTTVVNEQRQRRDVEDLLSITVNAMTDGLGVVDDEWRFTFVNDRLVEMIGIDRDDLVGQTVWAAVPELIGTEFEIAFRAAVANGTTATVRDRIDARDAWLEAIAYPDGGGLAVHLRDITESELAELRYRRAQAELATLGGLLDISRDAIVVRDVDHRISYANAGARALYAWDAIEVIGADARELVAIDRQQMTDAMNTVLVDGHWAGVVPVHTLDGRDIVVSSRWHLVRGTDGAPDSILSVSVDVTDEVARDEALRRTERLESLGTFAGGIAHDLNNVLTPILMASQLLGETLTGTAERETASMIETAARRGADMVRQVLAFTRGVDSRRQRIELADLLGELVQLTRGILAPGVELTLEPLRRPIAFMGDATQLLQVLSNLVSNANDAMSGSGTITVSAALAPNSHAGEDLVIVVADDGHGMSADVIDRLWEPFFTTKAMGKGTGLGLPMAAAIARSHGGTLEAESDGVSGSRFTLRIPIGEPHESTAGNAEERERLAPRGRGELVLVVDDEQAIRTIMRQALVTHGYDVLVTSSGDDAWRLIESGIAQPDVVVSDVMMPHGSGIELITRMIERGSTVPVVLMSGREGRATVDPEALRRSHDFVEKPISTPVLLRAVHDALTSHRHRKGAS